MKRKILLIVMILFTTASMLQHAHATIRRTLADNAGINKTDHNHYMIDTTRKKGLPKQRGFTNITELSVGYGMCNGVQLAPSYEKFDVGAIFSYGIQTTFGYQFNRYFSAGLGTGLDIEGYSVDGPFYIPVFAEERVCFLKGNVTPFLSLRAGYRFLLYNDIGGKDYGGLFVSPSLGLKIFITPKTAINFSFGYRYTEDKYDMANYYWKHYYTITNKYLIHLATFNTGFTF